MRQSKKSGVPNQKCSRPRVVNLMDPERIDQKRHKNVVKTRVNHHSFETISGGVMHDDFSEDSFP